MTSTLALAIALASVAAWAQPDADAIRESVVQVAVMRGGEVERLGSGFVVAEDGHVVTAAHLVADESSIAVVPLATGAELVARVSYIDERSGLALLAVNGLESPPLALAADGFDAGRRVYSAGVWSEAGAATPVAEAEAPVAVALGAGSVGRHLDLPDAGAVPLLEHNAMIPAAGYGGPLLNECGEVAGLNRGAPDMSRRQLRRGVAPVGVVHALRATAVGSLLQAQGVAVRQSESPCAGALAAAQAEAEAKDQQLAEATGEAEAAREQLEQARQEQEDAAARATEAQARVSALETQYEEAVRTGDEQADALRTELEAARGEQEEAQTAISALEEDVSALAQRQEEDAAAERMRLLAIGGGAAALVLALVIALALARRRRKRQVAQAEAEAEQAGAKAAQAAAEAAQAEADAAQAREEAQAAREEAAQRDAPAHPDCLLTGRTGDERPVSVKIPGSLLGGDGAIIGRSPRNSTLLIDDETLSREHARLFAKDGELHLEDLGSTNGTRLNGRDLDARAAVRVSAGDAIEFGAVRVALGVSA